MSSDSPIPPAAELAAGQQRHRGLIAAARQQAAGLISGSTMNLPALGRGLTDLDALRALLPAYELLREIQRGGQGVVFEALQRSTGRRVAIKVLRSGPLAAAGERLRFEREVQVLAQLNHPNIVGVLDSGAAGGAFYFAMEYVEGVGLDEWWAGRRAAAPPSSRRSASRRSGSPAVEPSADAPASDWRAAEQGLRDTRASGAAAVETPAPLDAALRLFIRICDAVHAAHLRGVIHRDLKPGNIRIDSRGEPRILDFGLAKLAGDDWAGSSVDAAMTQTGQFVGSLPWASPEQARGDADIDLRTDVYSLGVMLYQLVAGRFPYAVAGALRDVLNQIAGQEPQRPRTLPRGATRYPVSDELETIVLKALEKQRERRYQSAGELARDLERLLSGEPIAAKRDSLRYVLGKRLRRHRVPVAFGAALLASLLVGLAASLFFWQKAERDRRAADAARGAADAARREAETINKTLESMLAAANPLAGNRQDYTVREMLDEFAARLGAGMLSEQPLVEASLRETMAASYIQLAEFDRAQANLDRAAELRAQAADRRPEALARLLHLRAELLRERGDHLAAEAPVREAIALLAPGAAGHPLFLAGLKNALGELLIRQARYAEAETVLLGALAHARSAVGANREIASSLHYLASLYDELGEVERSIEHYRQCIDAYRALYGPTHPDVGMSLHDLAVALDRAKRDEEALAPAQEALRITTACYPPGHPYVAASEELLAVVFQGLGRLDEALERMTAAQAARRARFGEQSAVYCNGQNNLGSILSAMGRREEAIAAFDQSIAQKRREFPQGHPNLSDALSNRAKCEFALGRLDAAKASMSEALEVRRRFVGADHSAIADDLRGLITVLEARKDFEEALPRIDELIDIYRRGDDAPGEPVARQLLRKGLMLAQLGRPCEGEAALREAVAIRARLLPAAHWQLHAARSVLGATLAACAKSEEAATLLENAWNEMRQAADAPPQAVAEAGDRWASFLESRGEPERAKAIRAANGAAPSGASP